MKSRKTVLFVLIVAALLLAACQPAAPAETVAAEDVALRVTGNVTREQAWNEEQVKSLPTLEVESTNKEGETSTYTGVLISTLLAEAGPTAEASTVVFVAEDGSTAEVDLAEVTTCGDCIVSFRNQGGFSIVMPGYPGNMQVKGVIEIQLP